MSRVRAPQDEWSRINDLEQRLAKLERGNPLQGTMATAIDNNGVVRLAMGQLGDGDWGIAVYDASGVEQARMGQLNASPEIYGLGIRPYGGAHLQQVGGVIGPVISPNATNVTSAAYTAFGSPNTITAEIGPSGMAIVTVQCDIATGGSNFQGFAGVQLDGAGAWTDFVTLSAAATGGAQAQMSVGYVLTGLSVGTHTFKIGYRTANGQCSFFNPQFSVQPL